MARIGPDDPARDLRWFWLGPKGFRWPAAPVAAYGIFIVASIMASALVLAAGASPKAWLLLTALSTGLIALGVRQLFKHIDATKTVTYMRDCLVAEVHAPRPPVNGDTAGVEVRLSPAIFTTSRRDQQ